MLLQQSLLIQQAQKEQGVTIAYLFATLLRLGNSKGYFTFFASSCHLLPLKSFVGKLSIRALVKDLTNKIGGLISVNVECKAEKL